MKPTIFVLLLVICAMMGRAQSAAEKQLFDLVNSEREKAGLSKFEWNDRLSRAALEHSRLMEEHQNLSHQFAGEPGLQERLGATGARFNSVAENVAEAPEVAVAHRGLMHSPGHRANILNPAYNAIGISIVHRGDQLFVTQDFAHVLVSYTEQEFRDAMITGFNKVRHVRGLHRIDVITDSRLHKAACAQDMNTDRMIRGLPGAARLLVFSLTEPGTLPDDLREAATDATLERMNIGVCLQTGGKMGFSKFWVVTAFFRKPE